MNFISPGGPGLGRSGGSGLGRGGGAAFDPAPEEVTGPAW